MIVKLAELQGVPIAAAIFFRSGDTLYGRYWGAAADFHSLHFETCYYQGIEYCIEQGLRHFEPGTQGEHKVPRGFEPTHDLVGTLDRGSALPARDRQLPAAGACGSGQYIEAGAGSTFRSEEGVQADSRDPDDDMRGSIVWFSERDSPDAFPPVDRALREPDGLLAAGGDLSPSRLLAAYRRGIFPWYSRGQPILWWCPDPRAVLFPQRVARSRAASPNRSATVAS